VKWGTGIDAGNVHIAKHFIQESIRYGHVSELDHDAWLIYIIRYTVNEEALGRYFSRSSSVFFPMREPLENSAGIGGMGS